MLALTLLKIRPILPETEKLVEMGVRLALTLVAFFLAQWVLFHIVSRIERFIERAGHGSTASVQRGKTLGQILRNLCTLVVAGAVGIYALEILGWDVRPLLAGVGIIGVALGFGAQSLVRDVIAGIFILAENQFAVGDLIEVTGKAATVESITLRCTTLRDFNGFMHFVPNGEMKVVTNRSRGWNRQPVDIIVGADQDLDRALEVCRSVVADFNRDASWAGRLLDPVDVWGIEALGASEAQIRMVVRAKPGPDGPEACRELRRRIHRALGAASIRTFPLREAAAGPPPLAPPVPTQGP